MFHHQALLPAIGVHTSYTARKLGMKSGAKWKPWHEGLDHAKLAVKWLLIK